MSCNHLSVRLSFLSLVVAFILSGTHTQQVLAAKMSAAKVIMEQNATDGDAEVVFSAVSGSTGFAMLKVIAPDKRVIVDIKAPDSKLGLRHVDVESPEPADVGAIKQDYPAGEYKFVGTSVAGVELTGTATLSHELPPVAELTHPLADAEDISTKSLTITWKNPGKMSAIQVVLEQEDTGLEISARLPANATSFVVPAGFLQADTEYKVAIGTIAPGGNASFIEAEFSTK